MTNSYYKVEDTVLILDNWLNPASNLDVKLHIPLDPTALAITNIDALTVKIRKHFATTYGDTNVALEEKIAREYYSICPRPAGIITTIQLDDASLEYIEKQLNSTISKLNSNIKSKEGSASTYIRQEVAENAAHEVYDAMFMKIRCAALIKTRDAIIAIRDGELKEAYFAENNNLRTLFINSLDKVVQKSKMLGAQPPEQRWQYKQLSLIKGSTDNKPLIDKFRTELYEIGNRHMDYENNAFCVQKLKETKPEPKRELSIAMLYPYLKADLRTLKSMWQGRAWRKGLNFSNGEMTQSWHKFNDIKCKLMLLGYPEEKVTKLITSYCYNNGKVTEGMYGTCCITRQIIPAVFLVPLLSLNNKRGMANIYILHSQNSQGNNRAGTIRFEKKQLKMPNRTTTLVATTVDANTVTIDWCPVDYSEETVYVENKLPDESYYDATMCRHSMSALEFLTPRALPTENVMMYSKHKGYRPTPYLGIELEVEREEGTPTDTAFEYAGKCPEKITEDVFDALGRDFIIMKYDGSLRGRRPFEIVTIPATLEYHKKRWADFMNNTKLKSFLKSYKSGTCGMHVHISRDSFTGLHLAKFMRFINMADNHKFIVKVAQRGQNTYAAYSDKSIMGSANCIYHGDRGHYDAVNTSNANTIEVRIFRGNLAKTQFYKNMEFVHAVWQYTMECGMQELNYKQFLAWLFDPNKQHHKLYANLEKWLIAAKFNVSNVVISRTVDDAEKIKLLDERKRRKKIQLLINRRFKPTEEKVGNNTREELLASA